MKDIKEKMDTAQKSLEEMVNRFNAMGREVEAIERARQDLLAEMRRLEGEIRAYKGLLPPDNAKPTEPNSRASGVTSGG